MQEQQAFDLVQLSASHILFIDLVIMLSASALRNATTASARAFSTKPRNVVVVEGVRFVLI